LILPDAKGYDECKGSGEIRQSKYIGRRYHMTTEANLLFDGFDGSLGILELGGCGILVWRGNQDHARREGNEAKYNK
jgi:hypothetical protein